MKKRVEVVEVEDEGLITMLDEKVMVFTPTYIYAGTLTGVNDTFIKLEDGGIVYETGEWDSKTFGNFQKIPNTAIYLLTNAIISVIKTNKV